MRCCGPYIAGAELPPTAEALMRSRYTAYKMQDEATCALPGIRAPGPKRTDHRQK
jgi:uncharacterized protein YchJ